MMNKYFLISILVLQLHVELANAFGLIGGASGSCNPNNAPSLSYSSSCTYLETLKLNLNSKCEAYGYILDVASLHTNLCLQQCNNHSCLVKFVSARCKCREQGVVH